MNKAETKYYEIMKNSVHARLSALLSDVNDIMTFESEHIVPFVSKEGVYMGDTDEEFEDIPTKGGYFFRNISFKPEREIKEYEKANFAAGVKLLVTVPDEFFCQPTPYVQEQLGAIQKLLSLPEEERLFAVQSLFGRSMILADCFAEGGAWDGIIKGYGYDARWDLRIFLYEFLRPFAGKIRMPPIVQHAASTQLDVSIIFDGKTEAVLHIPVDGQLPLLLEKIRLPAEVFRNNMGIPFLEHKWGLPDGSLASLRNLGTPEDFYAYLRNSPAKDFL